MDDDLHHWGVNMGGGFTGKNAYKENAMLLKSCFYHSSISSGNWINNKTLN